MTTLTLTPKSLRKGVISETLPVGNVATVVLGDTYTQVALGGTYTVALLPSEFLFVRAKFKSSVAGTNLYFVIRKSDGVTVLFQSAFTAISSTVFTTIKTATPLQVVNTADWVNCQVWIYSNLPATITMEGSSLKEIYADSNNLTDIVGIRINVTDFFFYSVGASEGINGKLSNQTDEDFIELDVDGIISSIIWTGNSGNTIFSWGGSKIGVSA